VWSQSLLECFTSCRLSGSPAGPTSMTSSVPTTATPGQAPRWSGPFQARSGSARRFSQPLSGLRTPKLAALFRAAAVPGTSPSECSPRRNRAPLSGPHAPWQLSTDAPNAPRAALSPLVSPTSTLSRSSLVPPAAMSSLSTRRSTLPGHPGPRPTGSPVPSASPASKPSSSYESVRVAPGCPDTPADPLGFLPL
jgi:hypothetical protein